MTVICPNLRLVSTKHIFVAGVEMWMGDNQFQHVPTALLPRTSILGTGLTVCTTKTAGIQPQEGFQSFSQYLQTGGILHHVDLIHPNVISESESD